MNKERVEVYLKSYEEMLNCHTDDFFLLYDSIIKNLIDSLELLLNKDLKENQLLAILKHEIKLVPTDFKDLYAEIETLLKTVKYNDINRISSIYTLCVNLHKLLEKEYGQYFREETRVIFSEYQSSIAKESTEKHINGSFFRYEIEKLSESSSCVIADAGDYTGFQEYMHIVRKPEKLLVASAKNIKLSNKAHLILLCGNVGDGKSHLLSHVKHQYQDLFDDFTFINDATESMHPNENSLQSLQKRLSFFRDGMLDNEKNKKLFVLAINLGVLKNFCEFDEVPVSYSRLVKFISDSEIFGDNEKDLFTDENFSMININRTGFIDFEENIDSKVILEILLKITRPVLDNPFFSAYKRDITNDVRNHVLTNYELLSSDMVQSKLKELLLRVIIENNIILSMRLVFNFIHFLITGNPSKNEEENLLTNLVFSNNDENSLLKYISSYDPASIVNSKLNDIIVRLHYATGVARQEVLNNFSRIDKVLSQTNNISSFGSLKIPTIIRVIYMLPTNQITFDEFFPNSNYLEFIKILKNFNSGNVNDIEIYQLVKDSLNYWFNNKESGRNGFLYVASLRDETRFYQKIDLSFVPIFQQRNTNVLSLRFAIRSSYINLDIDYRLYELLIMIKNGYRPTNFDRKKHYNFTKFYDEIIRLNSANKSMIIAEDRKLYEIKYETSFDVFTMGEV